MKKLIAIAMLAASAALYADTTIFVVDIAQVHKNYYKTKTVMELFQSAITSANAELKAMDDKVKALVEEAKKSEEKLKNPALAEAAKQEIVNKEIAPKAQEIQQIQASMAGIKRQAQEKLANQQKEVIAEHRKEIVKVIEKIAADKKADFVFEKSAAYFSKPTADITEDVIATLNAGASK